MNSFLYYKNIHFIRILQFVSSNCFFKIFFSGLRNFSNVSLILLALKDVKIIQDSFWLKKSLKREKKNLIFLISFPILSWRLSAENNIKFWKETILDWKVNIWKIVFFLYLKRQVVSYRSRFSYYIVQRNPDNSNPQSPGPRK